VSWIWAFAGGYLLDALFGDPPRRTHPVCLFARAALGGEKILRRLASSPLGLRLAGAILVLTLVGGAWTAGWLVLRAAEELSPWLASAFGGWMIFSSLARRDLLRAVGEVERALSRGSLGTAREKVSELVGRDTACLSAEEVARAAAESASENLVDGVVAPLFYAALGGPALALAYRAVNTLDSLFGYRDERCLHFGWAAARLDDLANFLPARLGGLLLLGAAFGEGLPWKSGALAWRLFAPAHPSPNAGIPEAVTAGCLGLRFGGTNSYGGRVEERALLWPSGRPPRAEDLPRVMGLVNRASHLGFVLFGVGLLARTVLF